MRIIPKHVAIIMDGNRRWAAAHGRSLLTGHIEGEKRIEPIIDAAIEMGISTLTFWAFSTENWQRQEREVKFLLSFMRKVLDKKIDSYHLKNVRVKFIGDLSKFPADMQVKIKEWSKKTKKNTRITVNMALNYGGRDEIMRAINKMENARMQECKNLLVQKNNNPQLTTYNPQPISQKEVEKFLDTAGQPDPDLLIRTGGEMRLSGFMLWQLEYAELYFTGTLWPDFTPSEFKKAIEDYSNRVRRFGK